MGTIRKQAIYSSIVIYVGFLIGAVNTWLFTKNGAFTTSEYALTRLFFDVGQMIFAFASFGIPVVIYKFYPYYKDNLSKKENDLMTWSLLTGLCGFVLVVLGGWVFEPLIVKKFSANAILFVAYYKWVFPFGFGILFFIILETFSGTLRKTILPNFLKETGLRLLTLVLIICYYLKLINYDSFIKIFAFLYLSIAIILFTVLFKSRQLQFTFKISRVTEKFRKKILTLAGFVYSGQIIMTLALVVDGIFLASLKNIATAGIFSFAIYIASFVQVPQRSIVAITLPALSQAWKDKDMPEINRIYNRTSINLLLAALFIFLGIWLNLADAFKVLDIQKEYTTGFTVVFIIGISRIIDAGTGVNGQIIGTSTQWRFEFFTGIVLLLLILPLNYFLIKKFGMTGAAYATLISFTIYNFIRFLFLWKRYNLQPFTKKTFLSIVVAAVCYFITYYLFTNFEGWLGIILRSVFFTVLFFSCVFVFKLTPDAMQLVEVAKKRWINFKN